MKKILVTGAAGAVGIHTIKYLLSEGKYEITALDLRNKNSQKKLKKYRRRINLVYGDINDAVLMDALVKSHDYIIHLAGVIPPYVEIKKSMGELIDYNGTKNIINAINNYNPKCFLIYASSTTIYGDVEVACADTKPNLKPLDYYATTKLKIEKLITKELSNYVIIRLPFILSSFIKSSFIYQVKRKAMIECLTDNDAGYLFARLVECKKKVNGNIYNAGGKENLRINYKDLLINVLNIYGLSIKFILIRLFMDKNYYSPFLTDTKRLESIIDYQSDSLASYYMRLKRTTKKRYLPKLISKPLIFILGYKKK